MNVPSAATDQKRRKFVVMQGYILLAVQVNLKRCFYKQQLKNWDGKEQVCSFIEEKLNAAYKISKIQSENG